MTLEGFVQRNANQTGTQLLGTIDAKAFEFFLGRQIHQTVAVGDISLGGNVNGRTADSNHFAHGFSCAFGRVESRDLRTPTVNKVVCGSSSEGFLRILFNDKGRDSDGSSFPAFRRMFFKKRVNFAAEVGGEILDVFGAFEAAFNLEA